MKNVRVSVVGLGNLGACFAAAAASRGFETIGVDINRQVVDRINEGISPIVEQGLQELISDHRENLVATTNHARAIAETDVTFILVATPSDHDGNFSNAYMESALRSLSTALANHDKAYHTFVIGSTVMPSSTQERLIPLIERHSGKKLGRDFGVCYVPDFVALGSVLWDFLNPDMVVIGETDSRDGDIVAEFYGRFCENQPQVLRMNVISAEIAKVSLNTYLTMKISFANMLGNVCERVPDADVDAVTRAISSDRRISPYYLRAGLSYGGTCFPRDTRAFIRFAERLDYSAELIRIIEDINEAQDEFLFNRVRQCCLLSESTGVSVLGLAFKPGTPVITASPSIRLIERLLAEGIRVFAYDPLAMDNAKALLGDRIQYASSVKACMSREAVCVVATAAAEFAAIDRSYIGQNPTTLIDCWRILEPSKLGDQVHYVALSKRPAGRATRTTIDEQRNVQHKPRPSEERLRA